MKASGVDCCRDEIALIYRSVKVRVQRPLLGGKPTRDKARNVIPHDATVSDPIDDQNRADRKQDENTDAHYERRQQPDSGHTLMQMIWLPLLQIAMSRSSVRKSATECLSVAHR